MKKSLYVVLGIVVIIMAIIAIVLNQTPQQPSAVVNTNTSASSLPSNARYTIDDTFVTLHDGKAEEAIPDSSAKKITTLMDVSTTGDVNGDGKEDTIVILSQSSGGSGLFYYVAVALKTDTDYEGTTAILLGDRIAPQNNAIKNGIIVVNYADRKSGEPMTATPSVGVSKYMKVQGTSLIEIPTGNAMIRVASPAVFETVTSPLMVSGEARGNWYFEASFPVQVLDANGNLLAATAAQAQGDWMTENFVPFKATLTFTGISGQNGTIVFKKDNPSGLPQNEASVSIPIVFQ